MAHGDATEGAFETWGAGTWHGAMPRCGRAISAGGGWVSMIEFDAGIGRFVRTLAGLGFRGWAAGSLDRTDTVGTINDEIGVGSADRGTLGRLGVAPGRDCGKAAAD